MASRSNLLQAWKDALAGDPVSAFGGVLAANRCIDADCASAIDQIFYEVLIAPDFTAEAVELLSRKKNRILLRLKSIPQLAVQIRSVLGGYLVQDADAVSESIEDFTVVTRAHPQTSEMEDMVFALKIVKHTRSNAIVLVRNRQLIGSGTGQSSRIDAMRQAAHKARTFDFDVQGAVMASDAFFPFRDGLDVVIDAGAQAVIQPGGSLRDNEVIQAADERDIVMVFTGVRHFRH
ncbi:MAG: hypothetical protein EBX59_07905 [Betaproteobacteria bacterium]|nr:hypothetical protein [Betaproteobacteria bacterium]